MHYVRHRVRPRSVAIVVGIVCASLATLAIWNVSAFRKPSPPHGPITQAANKLREGLGSEVHFATANSSAEEIRGSVESVAQFIAARSGLGMSEETKKRLAAMEQQTLKGGHARIGIGELTNALTDTLVERMSTLKDRDIEFAGAALKVNADGGVMLRANGKFYATPERFEEQAKAFRDQATKSDKLFRSGVHAVLKDEVRDRIGFLNEGMPEQFGNPPGLGLSPLQAVLVAYSVAADDHLDFSQRELEKIVKSPASIKGGPKGRIPQNGRAYGPFGRLFSTPVNLLFNKKTVGGLLDRLEKGGS